MSIFDNPFRQKAPKTAPQNPQDRIENKSGMNPDLNDDTNKKKAASGEGDDPLMDFDKLWQPNVDKDGKPIKKAGPKVFTPQLDQKAMTAMLEKMDFTKDFSPEEMTAISKGGDEAAVAMGSMINKAAKRAFVTAFTGSSRMMEHAVQAARTDALSEIPNYVKDQMVDSELSRDNILMSNPAYKPMVDTIKKQFQERHPKASPAEINKAVRAYFDKMVSDMNKSKEKPEEITNEDLVKKGDPNANWEDWFDLELTAASSGEEGSQTQQSQQQETTQT